jgi:hypothetical protein
MRILQLMPAASYVALVETERGLISRPLMSLALVETPEGAQQIDGLLTGQLGRYASREPGFIGIFNRAEARRLAFADNSDRELRDARKRRGSATP